MNISLNNRVVRTGFALAALVWLLVGCGRRKVAEGVESAAAGVEGAAEEHRPPQVLRVGFAQGGGGTLTTIIREENLLETCGVQADFVLFTNSSDGLNALNVNKLDIGVSFGTCGPLTFASQGARFVIIGGSLSGGHPIMVKPENAAQYKTVQDFRGKTVGTPRIFTSDVIFRGALFDAGIDPKKDLTLVEFKRTVDVLEAVISGKVDAGVGATSVLGRAVQAGLSFPMFSNDFLPNHPCCRIVATEEAVRTKRPELVRYLKATLLAEKKFTENPETGVRALVNQQKLGDKLARDLVLEPHVLIQADPNKKGVAAMWAYMKRIGYAQGDLDLDKIIDTTLYYEALQELGTESPDPFWEKLKKRYEDQNL